jgi:hypothetical protein
MHCGLLSLLIVDNRRDWSIRCALSAVLPVVQSVVPGVIMYLAFQYPMQMSFWLQGPLLLAKSGFFAHCISCLHLSISSLPCNLRLRCTDSAIW